MAITIKLSSEERKLITLKAQEAREKVLKLVVKIIRWETESTDHPLNQVIDKITGLEWSKYKTHILGSYQIDNQERIKSKIKQTYETIKQRGGFK
ncbi:MAG: hypothetical protein ACD_31C00072G0003 [uncultured bacterium]|nr:MAG: hypothetical protein ACD_31C00072G0003 [uncultured bacterium]